MKNHSVVSSSPNSNQEEDDKKNFSAPILIPVGFSLATAFFFWNCTATIFLIIFSGFWVAGLCGVEDRRKIGEAKESLYYILFFASLILLIVSLYAWLIFTGDIFLDSTLTNLKDRFGFLGTVGDFFGGSLNSIFAGITLVLVIIEAKKSEIRESKRADKENLKSTIDYIKTTLDFFFKRVSFTEALLKEINYSGVRGLEAIITYNKAGNIDEVIEADLSAFLHSLSDLIRESFTNKATIASSSGINPQIAGIHSSKPSLVYPFLSKNYCSKFWVFIKTRHSNKSFINDVTWFVAFYIHLLKDESQKTCYDFIDEDFIAIQSIQRTLSQNNTNIFDKVTELSNGKL